MSVARRLLQAVLVVVTLSIGAAVAAVIITQTAWFRNWLRGYIVQEANQYLNGELQVGRLNGNLFYGVQLEQLGITQDGETVVSVQDVGVRYNVFQLISKGLSIDEIRLTGPVITLRKEGDTWNLARLIKDQAEEADREGPASPFSVDAIGISGASIVIDDGAAATPVGTTGQTGTSDSGTPRTPEQAAAKAALSLPSRIEQLDARLSFKYEPVRYSIDIDHVSFRTDDPALALHSLSGGIAVFDDAVHAEKLAIRTAESSVAIEGAVQDYLTKPRFNISVSSDKLSLPEIARLVPALRDVHLQPAFEIDLDGPLDHLGVTMNVRSEAGQISGELVADVEEPDQAIQGDVALRHLDIAAFLPEQSATDLTAILKADIQGPALSDVNALTGTLSLQADRLEASGYAANRVKVDVELDHTTARLNAAAGAYGANLQANGTATLPGDDKAVTYDIRGAVRRVDLRNLPPALGAPKARTDFNVRYRVNGTEVIDTPAARKADVDVTFETSTVPGASLAEGGTAHVTARGADLAYTVDASVRDVDLVELGTAFDVPALQDEQYRSHLNLRVKADGRGTSLATLDARAEGELTDATIMGGQVPQLSFTATVARDEARVTASGQFAGFNPAALSKNDKLAGEVAGDVTVDATVSALSAGVTADSVAGDVQLNLAPSTVGGVALTSAYIDASYRDLTADVRSLNVIGRDITASASGTLALNDEGQSNLTVHVDSPRLQELGKLFDVPVEGIAKVDATITGNRSELQAAGTLTGNGLKYEENGALALNSTFTARIPDLDAARAAVQADTSGTFITVAGQNVNLLTAKTTYDNKQLTFEATAKQPDRDLSAGGTVSLEPEQQELRLTSLGLQSRGVQLTLAPGADATVKYGGEAIAVDDLRLVSGTAELAVSGAFGRPDDALNVTVTNLDLAVVDALLLREPQLSGRFDATSTISGTKESPKVDGQFSVSGGGFRQFRYDSLGGTIQYEPAGVTVDARLDQNASQWLTAKGFVPAALFQTSNTASTSSTSSTPATPDGTAPATTPVTDPQAQIDLTVDSSPIDLGVVQGFTTALTDVKGTAEAHIHISGTADQPEPDGQITIRDGALKVAPTGGDYRNIAATVRLQPDRIRIEQLTVLDRRNSALSLTGDVALDEKRVSGVQLYVNADDFRVIDNELGDLRIQTSLEVAGDVKTPRVTGYLGINSGNINLDSIIAAVGTSPYPTAATAGTDETTPNEDAATSSGPYGAATVDVSLSIPDALVIKGDNLQPPGAPIGLGSIIVTLGGDVRATKQPGETLRLVGNINTIRGNYDFQGRRFEILRDGAIRLVGDDELNPTLDLKTRRIIQGVEARVNIKGTLQKPEIELSSTPPLEQADILALIVFNQPLNQLGEGQQTSLAARAQAIATGAVAGQLAQSIGNALNLDTFEIEVAPENGGGPQVTLGQQVGERLFVRVQQGIGDQSTTNFVLEYELAQWLRLQTNVIQGNSTQQSLFRRNQGSGADLIFFFSY